ncbi:MAG TPA: zinc-dependent alcohol dehydrogenase family protein [Candidatus Lokiarchaeia archaeon]|nr:zinc-dependent alcohol dehydrogenase family protein [Candidatus Lokiarchaeia archaeon]
MQALQFKSFGEPKDVLDLIDVPKLEPKPGQARIRMTCRPINPSDLLFIRGVYGIKPRLPAVPGFEGMGHIDAVGDDVTDLTPGQRVVVMGVPGTWQETVIARTARIIAVPDRVSDQSAAQLSVNPVTAWIMTTKELQLNQDEWLLQTAAGSTLGRMVLQIAAMRGFKTINFVRRKDQVQDLLEMGADVVICTEDPDPVNQVMKVTRGQGVHAAIDAVGGKTGGRAAKCLAPGGTMLVYGLLSGERIPLDAGEMIFKQSTIRGFWLSKWYENMAPELARATLDEVLDLMESGKLIPPVEAEYDLTNFKEAVVHAETPGRQGKVLLTG